MPTESSPTLTSRPWPMLLALSGAFAMSQAFRTVAAVLAIPLQAEFHLSPQQLGTFAGTFHFAFGAMQLIVGIGIDLFGVRRTVLAGFPLAIAGAVLAALAPGFGTLLLAQVLIGVGCAPAFLACTVFIARYFEAQRFAAVSGSVLSLGGIGLLATGTPLAWLVQLSSWRMGYWVLAGGSMLAWLLIAWRVREPAPPESAARAPREPLGRALWTFVSLLRLSFTPGILALASVCYASFLTLRGLWLGPMLVERNGYSLVQTGNVALVVSLVSLFGPPLFGRLDPGDGSRRRWLIGWTLLNAVLLAAIAIVRDPMAEIALTILMTVVSGANILQYAEVRAAYPPAIVGRALALFTMATFLGVAVMQWFTGLVASIAKAQGGETYTAVLLTMAAMLVLGVVAYARLPRAPQQAAAAGA